ncbi:SMP-30/gluconolactonase/LRE family protein [Dyadobacter sp. NIV53]|uniref:SMP-30/gluconolactonase/LRE family protein n=1 Tax=Dyadobacter sp. NIV53 TaxID=2861765 RepID=UPI001E32C10D|nr:SMP-30/gluconolactonase/LRE family protein [Dyadobacter sp. NIV53]
MTVKFRKRRQDTMDSLLLISPALWFVSSLRTLVSVIFFVVMTACTIPQTGEMTAERVTSHRLTVSVKTFAGTDTRKGYADGKGTAARFLYPGQMVFDKQDNLYVIDQLYGYVGGSVVRKIDAQGNVTTFAKGLSAITDICIDPADGKTIYVIESGDQTSVPNGIFRIDANGIVKRLSGGAGLRGYEDGPLVTAKFNRPGGIAMDNKGNLFVADAGNYCVRKVNLKTGMVTTLAGQHLPGQTNCFYADGHGKAAQFCAFDDLTLDDAGNVFVPDRMNHRVRRVTSGGDVSTYLQIGGAGTVEGPLANAKVWYPTMAHFHTGSGQLYLITDSGKQLDVVTRDNYLFNLSRYIGQNDYVNSSTGTTHGYYGLAVNSKGELFIADKYNHCIRKIIVSW